MQPANWVMKGYATKEKAIAATKRLGKLNLEEDDLRDTYEVLDGDGMAVWSIN